MKYIAVWIVIEVVAGNDLGELPANRPLVIAHRGSSGELPEHTVAAYQRAVDQGADIIECDLAVTKDRVLICSHEPMLSSTTDVKLKYPERVTTYTYHGLNITDYFSIDFTLDELKTLRKVQTRSFRDQSYNGMYEIATLEEHIAVAQGANRTVGIYPETKFPDFFNRYLESFNTTFEDMLIDVLSTHGYTSKKSPCFLQSFDLASIQYLAGRTDLRLVYLMETDVTDELLANMSSYVTGIGPWKQAIVQVNQTTRRIVKTTDFMDRVKEYGYKIHPYTFRNEDQFLAFDYGADPYQEYKRFVELGVHGLFTDFPSTMVNYLSSRETQCSRSDSSTVISCPLMMAITLLLINVEY